jgi:hypothetical protein
MLELVNNFSFLLTQDNSVDAAFLYLLLSINNYLYIFLKFYKVLCFSKMTFDWLPMINPYAWPFAMFGYFTTPYFKFWSGILPNIRTSHVSLEISAIIGLEALNSFTTFSVFVASVLVKMIEEIESV